jgi:glycerol uptake facilitator-like aquaporin
VPYIVAQTVGALVGVGIANLMFELPLFFASQKIRTGSAQFLSEFIGDLGMR